MRETRGTPTGNGLRLTFVANGRRRAVIPRRQPRNQTARAGCRVEEAWMFNNADEVSRYISDNDVKFVDVRFCDLPGVMQHFTIPAQIFEPGETLAFDGSSIRGFQAIHESDMAL